MAVTTLTAVNTSVVSDKVSVTYRDYHGEVKASTNFSVIPAATQAQLVSVATALDAVSTAKLCFVNRNSAKYAPDSGADSAAGGNFSEVSDFIQMKFVSASRCDADIYIDVLAPIQTVLTGPDERLVNNSNADIIALATAISAILTNPRVPALAGGALNDYSFAEGVRNRIAKEPRLGI